MFSGNQKDFLSEEKETNQQVNGSRELPLLPNVTQSFHSASTSLSGPLNFPTTSNELGTTTTRQPFLHPADFFRSLQGPQQTLSMPLRKAMPDLVPSNGMATRQLTPTQTAYSTFGSPASRYDSPVNAHSSVSTLPSMPRPDYLAFSPSSEQGSQQLSPTQSLYSSFSSPTARPANNNSNNNNSNSSFSTPRSFIGGPDLLTPSPLSVQSPLQSSKIQHRSSLTGSFRGEYEENYSDFAKALNGYINSLASKTAEERSAETLGLGAVSRSTEYFFEPTKEAVDYAREFFTAFWSREEHVKAIDAKQQEKYRETRKRCNTPQCISFIAVEGETTHGLERLCYVAISSWGSEKNSEHWNLVKSFVDEYNTATEEQKLTLALQMASNNSSPSSLSLAVTPRSRSRFEMLDMATPNFHELIAKALLGVKNAQHEINKGQEDDPIPELRRTDFERTAETIFYDPTRDCSEKGFGAELAKIHYERYKQGKPLKIDGVVNCVLYPYEKNQKTGKYVTPLEKVLEENGNHQVEAVAAGKVFYMPAIPCCKNCQVNKPGVLSIIAAAKAFGQAMHQEMISSPQKPKLIISPLRSSKFTPDRGGEKRAASQMLKSSSTAEGSQTTEASKDLFKRMTARFSSPAHSRLADKHGFMLLPTPASFFATPNAPSSLPASQPEDQELNNKRQKKETVQKQEKLYAEILADGDESECSPSSSEERMEDEQKGKATKSTLSLTQ